MAQQCGYLNTEDGRRITTESARPIVTECFTAETVVEEIIIAPWSGVLGSGAPAYIRPRKKKVPWPGDEIEEDELEEVLAMIGIDL